MNHEQADHQTPEPCQQLAGSKELRLIGIHGALAGLDRHKSILVRSPLASSIVIFLT